MPTPFDQLAKEVLDLLLHDLGHLETEVEVAALPSQRADLLFIPDPRRSAERRALGLIGRMTEAAVLFEPFHEAPGVHDVLACLRKVLNHRHARSLSQRDGAERSWLLCAGRPDTAIGVLRATPSDGWPRGFYDLGAALPLSLVVLSELDDGDDTLPLRLMGTGPTLRAALHALRTRYGALPRGRALFAEVVQVFLAARRRGERRTEDVMVDLSEAYEYMQQQHTEGLRLVRVVEARLARALTDPEWEALSQRIDRDGAASVTAALDALDGDALARWLTAARP